jgi:PAS domain S-box-containing protein
MTKPATEQVSRQPIVPSEGDGRFRALIESITDYSILMLDVQGRITTWSKGAQYINGYCEDEIIGRHFSCFYTSEDIAQRKPESELDIAASRGRFQDQALHVRKDGSRFWAEVVITPILNNQGRLEGFAKVTRDLTGRRRAEQKFRDLLESAPDAIVIVGQEGEIILVNSQTEKLFGYNRDELIGDTIERLMPERLRDRHMQLRGHFLAAPRTREMGAGLELFGQNKNGAEFPVQISLSPLETDEGTLVSAAIRDITERKSYERMLQNRNIALEAAVKELDAFSYSVSHDLRAPLRAIAGFNRILLDEHAQSLSEEARDYLCSVRDNAIQMGHLVDDLLEFSRLGRKQLAKHQVSISRIVDQVVSDARRRFEDRDIQVIIGDLPPVYGDPVLLKQVFVNLIDNAFKYTRGRDKATVEIGSREEGGERVFFVKDNGAGFDMKYVDKLFGVFQRLHRAEDFEGTGAGLAIVQRIIKRHGGRIWAQAAVDQGATLYLTMEGSNGS